MNMLKFFFFLLMPEKRKQKDRGQSLGAAHPAQRTSLDEYDRTKFKSFKYERRYKKLENQNYLFKRRFSIEDSDKYEEFTRNIEGVGCGRLTNPRKNINYETVKEFYANVYHTKEFPYTGTGLSTMA